MELQVAKLPPQLGVGTAIAGIAFTALLFSALTMTSNGPCGGFCFARISDESVVDFYAD
jgi:hypothetical protein